MQHDIAQENLLFLRECFGEVLDKIWMAKIKVLKTFLEVSRNVNYYFNFQLWLHLKWFFPKNIFKSNAEVASKIAGKFINRIIMHWI